MTSRWIPVVVGCSLVACLAPNANVGPSTMPEAPPVLFVRSGVSTGDCEFLGGTQASAYYRAGTAASPSCACELPPASDALATVRAELIGQGLGLGGDTFFVDHLTMDARTEALSDCCVRSQIDAEIYVYRCPAATRLELEAFADASFQLDGAQRVRR